MNEKNIKELIRLNEEITFLLNQINHHKEPSSLAMRRESLKELITEMLQIVMTKE